MLNILPINNFEKSGAGLAKETKVQSTQKHTFLSSLQQIVV